MNAAEPRAEPIDPALKAAGRGGVEDSRIRVQVQTRVTAAIQARLGRPPNSGAGVALYHCFFELMKSLKLCKAAKIMGVESGFFTGCKLTV